MSGWNQNSTRWPALQSKMRDVYRNIVRKKKIWKVGLFVSSKYSPILCLVEKPVWNNMGKPDYVQRIQNAFALTLYYRAVLILMWFMQHHSRELWSRLRDVILNQDLHSYPGTSPQTYHEVWALTQKFSSNDWKYLVDFTICSLELISVEPNFLMTPQKDLYYKLLWPTVSVTWDTLNG
jgi:hypothetical protein